jgi:Polysaccharide lyase
MPRRVLSVLGLLSLASFVATAGNDRASIAVPGVVYACLFQGTLRDCQFMEQAKVAGRATMVSVAGVNAVRLHTEPGDSEVARSRQSERNDLRISQATTDGYEGKEHWWAHSILFPDDYVDPPESTSTSWNWGAVGGFHNTASGAGQGNLTLMAMPATAISPDRPTGLNFQIAYGDQANPTTYVAPIGPIVRNQWYNFVYHVKWTSGPDGFFDAWVNGARKMAYRGPTLYAGQGVYLKLANYHTAFGKPSSVIHARVLRGATPRAVSSGPLEAVLP